VKILHALYESRGDYFGIGGVGTRAYDIYGYLKERHDITLLCKKYPGARDGEKDGLKHIFVGASSRSLTRTFLSYAFEAARFVRREGKAFDIIIEEFSPAIPSFLHAATDRPLILQVQGYTGNLYFRKYNPASAGVLTFMERLRPRMYDNFIVVSKGTVERLALPSGKRIAVISNGISPDLLKTEPVEEPYVLYLGRIDVYGKGLDLLLHAYREFCGSFPAIRLAVAGDGRDRAAFEARIMKLPDPVKRNIELTGWVSGDRKAEVLRKTMFCIVPSRHDVQSIAVLEAMACGKPVIVSDIPELRYVTEQGAGLSFTSGNASSLAACMRALADRSDRQEMGRTARAWARDYTIDRIALRFEEFIREVAGKT